jgi:hypothetical protein
MVMPNDDDSHQAEAARDERPTVVLLGASNLTRGISIVVKTLQVAHDSPVRIVTALNHGRSFGKPSRVLARGLPSMAECGLWNAIEQPRQRTTPSFALITDIGNDVMYEVEPGQIIDWVSACAHRLIAAGVPHVNITALPVESIARVRPWQYALVRAVLFPTHHLTFEQAVSRALETQHRLEQFVAQSAHAARLRLIPNDGEWYGFDPIHIRRARWPVAWARFLSRHPHQATIRAAGSIGRWMRLRSHMPEQYDILGLAGRRRQPLTLADGTTIEMY